MMSPLLAGGAGNHGLVAMVMTQSADFLFTDAMPAFWTEVYRALAT